MATNEKRIIIVQPRITLKEEDRECVRRSPDNIWCQIVLGDLMVIGQLVVGVSKKGNEVVPLDYVSWNWPVKAGDMRPESVSQSYLAKCNFFLLSDHSSSAKFTLGFRTCSNAQDYMGLMLHLAIKQMVPSLSHTADLIDLALDPGVGKIKGVAKKHEVAQLGFLAVTHDCLYGIICDGFARTYSLGFQVVPGLCTYNGCEDWDRWLQYLVSLKFSQLRHVLDTQAYSLLGPKPLF